VWGAERARCDRAVLGRLTRDPAAPARRRARSGL